MGTRPLGRFGPETRVDGPRCGVATGREQAFAGELPVPSRRYFPDGALAYPNWDHGVAFLAPSGRKSARPPIRRRRGPGSAGCPSTAWAAGLRWAGATAASASTMLPPAQSADQFDWERMRLRVEPGQPMVCARRIGKAALSKSPDARTPPFHPATASADRSGARLQSGRDEARLSSDRTAVVWDVASHQEWLSLRGTQGDGQRRRLQPRWIVGRDHVRRPDHPDLGRPRRPPPRVLPGPGYMQAVTFSPDGDYLAASGNNGARFASISSRAVASSGG